METKPFQTISDYETRCRAYRWGDDYGMGSEGEAKNGAECGGRNGEKEMKGRTVCLWRESEEVNVKGEFLRCV